MTLKEHYNSLRELERPLHPAKQFIYTIAEKTGRSHKTVQQWISGIQEPNDDLKVIISGVVGIPPEELFP
ncbi:MAG: replication/maintenance protein RepL [Muribaculum sp.]|nr:replication/maintenance protein RepL [Muribaculum sp.]